MGCELNARAMSHLELLSSSAIKPGIFHHVFLPFARAEEIANFSTNSSAAR